MKTEDMFASKVGAWGHARALGLLLGIWVYAGSAWGAETGDTLYFEVDADNHAFMCPFLSPIFMGLLEDAGAYWVAKDEVHRVHVAFPLGSMDEEGVLGLAVKTGYMEEIVTVVRRETPWRP